MHGASEHFIEGIAPFLCGYYLVLSLMNAVAALYLWLRLDKSRDAIIWLAASMVFVLLAALAGGGQPPEMPRVIKDALNAALTGNRGAVVYSVGTTAALIVAF